MFAAVFVFCWTLYNRRFSRGCATLVFDSLPPASNAALYTLGLFRFWHHSCRRNYHSVLSPNRLGFCGSPGTTFRFVRSACRTVSFSGFCRFVACRRVLPSSFYRFMHLDGGSAFLLPHLLRFLPAHRWNSASCCRSFCGYRRRYPAPRLHRLLRRLLITVSPQFWAPLPLFLCVFTIVLPAPAAVSFNSRSFAFHADLPARTSACACRSAIYLYAWSGFTTLAPPFLYTAYHCVSGTT